MAVPEGQEALVQEDPSKPVVICVDDDQMIPFSAVTGEGRNDLAEAMESLLEQPSWKEPDAPS